MFGPAQSVTLEFKSLSQDLDVTILCGDYTDVTDKLVGISGLTVTDRCFTGEDNWFDVSYAITNCKLGIRESGELSCGTAPMAVLVSSPLTLSSAVNMSAFGRSGLLLPVVWVV